MRYSVQDSQDAGRNQVRDNAEQTFFGLRFGLFLLLALLSFAIVWQSVGDGGILCGSISAYYYTAAGPVFVGTLCAIGAALVIYRGSNDAENTALDVAGFLAFVVAFVPASPPQERDPSAPMTATSCTAINVPSATDVASAVQIAVPSLFLAGFAAVMFGATILRRPGSASGPLRGFALVALGALLGGFAVYYFLPDLFGRFAHHAAAICLFLCMIAVVALNAVDARRKGGSGYARRYGVLAACMVVGCVAFLLSAVFDVLRVGVLVAEAVGIVGFAVFWLIQTLELRRRIVRPDEKGLPELTAL